MDKNKIRTNEFIYTVSNGVDNKDEIMEVICLVLNQYIKYQNPNLDICFDEDRKNVVGYLKYCIQSKEDSENECLYGIIERLTYEYFDYLMENAESLRDIKDSINSNIRRNFHNNTRVQREWLK